MLERLYSKETKARWAYEHELKRMKYLHKWSDKQGIEFKEIESQIIINRIKKKENGFSVNLSVSTEYQYVYEDTPETYNSFRTGSYHVLNLAFREERLVIAKEWYRDPFADSLNLETIENQKVKELILSGKAKDLSDLAEKRVKALEYVDQYCGAASPPKYGFKYNAKYKNYNYQGGDCTNFISQVLYEAGGFTKNRIWNYKQGSGSKAWVNAHAFNKYMLNSGRASLIARGTYDEVLEASYKLLPGDYIAYEKKGKVAHVSIVTGIDSKGYILVSSHNADRYRVPWDLGWSNKGIKFWIVRVHY
ncbi:amidase domain-containing protein [Sporohalobacter salinus]|uniref:amidase domain-containing protein n=1 Tax=Sporohalobacter salinus TaxID=1494606 RepID=UPI001EF90D04|nr:amidase domain-containing protein [Sporohalobacter salinus]MBM7622820.1 surface antigen [Sporohalobacter salinus]